MPRKNDMSPLEDNGHGKEREMHGTHAHGSRTRPVRHLERHGVVVEMNTLSRLRVQHEDRPLRCVSSGYMSGGCSCGAVVPAAVVQAVWQRELARAQAPGDCFFRFAWRGEQWLAFGLANGHIRGVYCPTHRAERDARTAGREARHPERPARAAA
jgi:hypothetical protein